MNIFIAGGGRVGFHLARLLSTEHHDVTVIEADHNQMEQIDYALDVSTIEGNAASILTLKTAGVGKGDLFVALTGDDEINLIAATTAKGLGARQVVARVDSPLYIESNFLYETILGVDFILSPEFLTAQEIANYIDSPGLVAMEDFGRGRVRMRQVRVKRTPTRGDKTLKDVKLPPGVLLGLISRNGKTIIPRGDAKIEVHDLVTLVGEKEMMDNVQKLFQGTEPSVRTVVIAGGGTIGMHLASIQAQRGRKVKLLEWNPNRCNELAVMLKQTTVVCRDATSRVALEQEHVEDADMFVAATKDDERNIMAGVLAKEVGADQTVAVVHQPDFAPLVSRLGIDYAVTPRASIANRVLKLIHQKEVSSLSVLEEGQIEVIEMPVAADAPIIGRQLKDVRFPKDSLVTTILRGDNVIIPRGEDEIHAGDSVIVISSADSLEGVQKIFQR
jgi:trk system potassium uptake protein TrkA